MSRRLGRWPALVVLVVLGCGASEAVVEAPAERPSLSFTDWTAETELFVELPALVVGESSRFVAHFTQLADFSPVREGRATVVLTAADGREERFEIEGVLRDGIFVPEVSPAAAGPRTLRIELASGELHVVHHLGDIDVYPDDAAARAALGDEPTAPGRVVFLKEQQWSMPFGTEVASERALRASVPVYGRIEARPEGDVTIRSPASGRVLSEPFADLGATVERDGTLAMLAQQLDAADRASLDLARSTARIELAQAEQERARIERLAAEGVVPERRLVEARHMEEEARAALEGATRRLGLFERGLRTGGGRGGALAIRSPIVGQVIAIEVAPGALVTEGDALFRVLAPGSRWLVLDIPERDLPRLGDAPSASFRVPGETAEHEVPSSALASRARVIDPDSRMSGLVFTVDLPELALGAHVEARVFDGPSSPMLAIPWAALSDEGGYFVAFVQVEGEAFERRVVRLGPRDGAWVGVVSGIAAGEHVVTTGALAVRLAASSGTVPAHGHSH